VLSAPLLATVGSTFGAGPGFYVRSLAVYPLFLVLPAMVAALLVIGLVRWWGPFLRALVTAAAGALLVSLVLGWRRAPDFDHIAATTGIKNAFASVMGYTEASMSRFLPSAWMAEQILLWARGFEARGTFFGLLLASWVLLTGWICLVVASPATYRAWNLSQGRRVGRVRRRVSLGSANAAFAPGWTRWLPFVGRDTAALIRKDLREFGRDPAQWIPCAVVFAMLLVYAANLNRAMDSDPDRPYFRLMLSSLNFGVCGLTLSTLTTRFVFPMFSLEGRRLWILGMSPVGLARVFQLKLLLFGGILAMATATLMLVSGLRLGMKPGEMLHYCGAIVLMSGGLTTLALSLGVLFPNFHDPSPARIVSGFGGTLCLILNFLYIIAFLPLFIWPGFRAVRPSGHTGQEWFLLASAAALVALTSLTAGLPAFFALRKIKKLEFLGNV
jgi:ABC-2 type transport system permease protein